jgi:hypothetical protein
MTVWPARAGDQAAVGLPRRQAALFTTPPRLGWVFRDRRQLMVPFTEPPPAPVPVPQQLQANLAAAEQALRKTRRRVTPISVIVVVGFILLGGCDRVLFGGSGEAATIVVGLLAGGPGLAVTAVRAARRRSAAAAITQATGQARTGYGHAVAGWQQRKDEHDRSEAARVDALPEWGPAVLPGHVRRIDIFGGSLWGWEALLTVHGASRLAEAPLLVIDLTGEQVTRELAATAQEAGILTTMSLLPTQLGDAGVVAALSPGQLADALCEVMHAGAADGARADRALDARILEQVTGALGGQVTLARLTAAVRVLLGTPGPAGVLEEAEYGPVMALFPADYRQHIQPSLARIESFLAPLTGLAGQAPPRTPHTQPAARLRCLALEPAARSARTEILAGLLVQWLTVQATTGSGEVPAVIIAGADEITRPHLERLSDACERRSVPLTLLFRHLRETAADMAGGGATGFMRLGNHKEATAAADLIGRQHKFVLSQLTATLGGSQTHTRTATQGETHTHTATRGWHQTTTHTPHPGGGLATHLASRATGRSESFSHSVSRNWSTALSWANGTNWSDAEATQRVYEYTVEPTTLQNLPDHALLLLTTRTDSQNLAAVECDPAVVTLPRVSTTPLPEPPPPQTQIPASQPQPPPVWRPSQQIPASQPPHGGWQPPPGPPSWPQTGTRS